MTPPPRAAASTDEPTTPASDGRMSLSVPDNAHTSEREFRRIIDNLIDTFYRTDLSGRLVIASQSARELLGWAPAELIGQRLADFYVDPRGRDNFLRLLQNSGGKLIGYEAILRRKDGSEVWVETNAHYVRDERGAVVGVEGTVRDITTRRATEKALRESEERFRRLHELSSTGIGIHENGLILDANKALSRLTGYSTDELIGMDGLLLVEPSHRAQAMENIRSGNERPYRSVGQRKDGTCYPVEITGKNIPYQGRTVRVTEFHDLSAIVAAEREREQLQAQLQQAQKMEAIGQLTGGIAHDFNNIMTAVLGYAKLARSLHAPDGTTQLAEFLDQIIRAGERAANLVTQMMAFSRGGAYSDLRTLSPSLLLDEVLKMLRPTLPSTLEIQRNGDGVVPMINADPLQLHQVLTNLIINARDAVGERGKLEVHVGAVHQNGGECASCHGRITGSWVGIVIADDGPGMSAATIDQIFQPFFTTKEVGKGSGMGLSVAHGIIHRLGGHILVDSSLGRGAKFTVLLPGAGDAQPYAATHDGLSAPSRAQAGELTGLRVLVVDDEPVLCRFFREALEAHGCIVATATSPRVALLQFQNDPDAFDIVLTDQTMPAMTGAELLQRLLALRPSLPVVMCTGYSSHLDANRAAALGAAAFLAKPVTIDVLLHTLARVARRHAAVLSPQDRARP